MTLFEFLDQTMPDLSLEFVATLANTFYDLGQFELVLCLKTDTVRTNTSSVLWALL